MVSDNPNVSLGNVASSLYNRRTALKKDYLKKEWTCLLILLWSPTVWRLYKRLLSFPRDQTNSFRKTFLTMLQFVELPLQ